MFRPEGGYLVQASKEKGEDSSHVEIDYQIKSFFFYQ